MAVRVGKPPDNGDSLAVSRGGCVALRGLPTHVQVSLQKRPFGPADGSRAGPPPRACVVAVRDVSEGFLAAYGAKPVGGLPVELGRAQEVAIGVAYVHRHGAAVEQPGQYLPVSAPEASGI
jgi:hypothetical protein